MNYSLALEEKNNYEKLDLSLIIPNKEDRFDLEHIDNFTIQFENEYELKEYLIAKGLIKEIDFQKEICIFYGLKNKRNIPVLYKSNKETIDKLRIFSKEINKYFLEQKRTTYSTFSYDLIMRDYKNIADSFPSFEVFAGNHKFLNELQRFVSNNPKQKLNIKDISTYITQLSGDKKSKVISIALFETFRMLFYTYDKEKANLIFNYKGFRDFCVFYCDYKNNRKSLQESIQIEEDFAYTNESSLSSAGDPDFPFNSEEEEMYNRYLENLPEEEHPHRR